MSVKLAIFKVFGGILLQEENIYQNIQNEMILKILEREKVKKTAFRIGTAYLLLLFIPLLCNFAFIWSASYFKFNIQTVLSEPIFQNMWQISVSMIMMVLPALFLIRLERKTEPKILLFDKPKKKLFLPFIFIGLGVCAFANIATNVIAVFLEELGIFYSSPELTKPDGIFGTIIIILSSAVTPALVEEFLMRGAILGSIRRYGEDIAVIVSAILFGFMHANILQIPFAFMVGLILGYAVIKTGSIWTGVAIHFINNFMSVLLSDLIPFGEAEYLKNAVTTLYFAISLALFFIGIFMLSGLEKGKLKLQSGELKATFKEKLGWFFSSPTIILGILLTVLMTAEII